ncbi:TetR family transcriptional regulator [Kocuria koreensis]|uniref:TetR family transcriptional regulator n=1 Tax=Rothia koreensis TaxID=592378 RepID=A0A7K1LK45_9MICC|nr:TetR/AcrR family transcriptional regulator [Rothia koreensis]MUN55566.1 TetR family transcriptional regulator [Rothia koreensis]
MTSECGAEAADPRIAQTRRAFKTALYDAAAPEWNWKVSVSELCKRAGVSRSTFYQHFAAVDDVYTELLRDRLVNLVSPAVWRRGAGVPRSGALVALFEDLRAEPGFYEPILGETEVFGNARRSFIRWVAERLSETYFGAPYETLAAEPRQRVMFIAGGAVVTMGYWVYSSERDPSVTPVEISAYFNSYVSALSTDFVPTTPVETRSDSEDGPRAESPGTGSGGLAEAGSSGLR